MPPQEHPHRHIGAYVILLAALVVIAGLAYAFFPALSLRGGPVVQQQTTQTFEVPAGFPKDAPAPTANDLAASQRGFSYLVSYNGSSFVPLTFNAQKGEVVRFVNNGQRPIVISIVSVGTQSTELATGEYWEFDIPATSTKQIIFNAAGSAGQIKLP